MSEEINRVSRTSARRWGVSVLSYGFSGDHTMEAMVPVNVASARRVAALVSFSTGKAK